MRRLVLTFVCLLYLSGSALAACTGASPSWSCSSWADLKALAEGASVQSGDTLTLASGTHSVTSTITPARAMTIRGSGTLATTLTVSSSSTFLVGSSGSAAYPIMRITNFVINSTTATYALRARGRAWRVDNNVFDARPYGAKVRTFVYDNRNLYCSAGWDYGGLVDSNTFYQSYPSFYGSAYALLATNFSCHATAINLGGDRAVYFEDNKHYNDSIFGDLVDSDFGGAYVLRFNEMTKLGTSSGFVTDVHGFRGDWRSSRTFEQYKNTYTNGDFGTTSLRGGTGVVFGNTFNPFGGNWTYARIQLSIDREADCGSGSATSLQADGNELPSGWPCRDGIGMGKDQWAWSGSGNYPTQDKVPAYIWGNGAAVISNVSAKLARDRDWYDDTNSGVRTGTRALMNAASCTTGQAWWVTDEGYWNTKNDTPTVTADGVLYKCTATNVWTPYYVPYPYPHPLRSGLAAPTGVTVK